MGCRYRESVDECEAESRSGVEKLLLGCFLGKVLVEVLLGDPNGSDHVLADAFLL